VATAQLGRAPSDPPVDGYHGECAVKQWRELCLEALGRLSQDASELIEHLDQVDRGYDAIPAAQQHLNVVSRRLVPGQRHECEGVEHRRQGRSRLRWSACRSSVRAAARSSSEVGVARSAKVPRSAVIGSSGAGRTTSSSPRSSIVTREVFHRRLTSAGTEI